MPGSVSSSCSSSEDELPITNGVKHITLENGANGKAENGKDSEHEESEPEEPCEAGMKAGLKNLYSGKEDKKGRYQWQDKIPEDLGDPAENDKTAKWALLVRNVKVYSDPRRVSIPSPHFGVHMNPCIRIR